MAKNPKGREGTSTLRLDRPTSGFPNTVTKPGKKTTGPKPIKLVAKQEE